MVPFKMLDILDWIKGKKEADIDELDINFFRGVYLKIENETEGIEAYNRCIELCSIKLDSKPNDLKALEYRAAALIRTGRFDEARNDIDRVVELNPENPDIYLQRALYYQQKGHYPEAISDFSKAIEIDGTSPYPFFYRAQCHHKNGNFMEAIADYTKAIESSTIDNDEYHTLRAQCYVAMNKLNEAMDDFTKSIELNPDNEKAYRLRGELFEKKGQYDSALKDYNKVIEIEPYADAFLKRADLFHYSLNQYDSAIDDYYTVISNQDDTFHYTTNDMYEEIIEASKKLAQHQAELENQLKEEKIREEERKKIIADLSHSIKNLISTVIDPLENLKQEASVKPQVIENALRGANLIREIVNAVNLSFKGSIEDFRYDTAHNTDSDSQDVKAIITAALKHSVGNMFDGKYFGIFMRKYFPEKPLYLAAKAEWSNLSQANSLDQLQPFLETYFFNPDFDLNQAEQFVIGNQKGSIIKLMILFQEMILNAVKYSSFIDRKSRFLKIRFEASGPDVSILVENPFDAQTKVKTSGIGHVIIQNFAQLLDTTPVIKNDGGIYSVQIRFQNIWKEAVQ
jgi:tetratricopeptide (TPR) repeat protein